MSVIGGNLKLSGRNINLNTNLIAARFIKESATFNHTWIHLFLTIIILVALFAGHGAASEQILVRGDDNYPPYEFLDEEGNPTGFNVELFQAVAKTMGINATIELGPWNEVRSDIEDGSADVLTGMYYSPERAEYVLFSTPHIIVSHAIFVRDGSNIKDIGDLDDANIIVQEGDIMHDYALSITDSSRIITVRDQEDALILLSSGQHDAALLGKLQAVYNMNKLGIGNLQSVGPVIEPRDYCFAVSQENEELLQQLNEGLAIVKQSGEYNRIYNKWFGKTYQETGLNSIARSLLIAVFFVSGLAVILFLWLRSVKDQVARKTHELNEELEQRKKTEEELAESKKKYEDLVEKSHSIILKWSRNGEILFLNKFGISLFGYEKQEIIGKNVVGTILPEYDDNGRSFSYFVDELFENSDIFENNISENICKDGRRLWISWSNNLMHDQEGRVTGMYSVGTDITERKRFEEELLRTKEDAEAANIAKSEFLANMSHEIRTPMNSIIGFNDILLETELNEQQRHFVEVVQKSGKHLLDLIEDILDLSKIEAGKFELEMFDFNLSDMMESFVNTMSLRAHSKGLKLILNIDDNVPSRLRGDSGRLLQILTNLTGNAIKFTSEGEVKIHVSVGFQTDKSTILLFTVSDTGIGIPENKIETIFEKFSQVDASNTRRFGGTGLGLSISKQLVEMMGGEIGATSQEGKGSDFWFTVKLEKQPETEPVKRHGNTDVHRKHNKELKVLLVEDNLDNQELAQNMLKKFGLNVDTVDGGKEAIKALESTSYDLVFMDIQMPDMSGMEVTKLIRNPGSKVLNKDIPIIAVTAYALKGDRERFIEAGMDDYIPKPISLKTLREVLDKWDGDIVSLNQN
ncbi:MAG: hypothetical protein PWQ51_2002 [Methanolobus sp.]|jgi:two-component system sensor histidine kinase EvgS|nr:hypothetical protein [Methanolobus sp.]